ncbi:unnamed protein product, partial [Mesorhabditis belari]|uniref:Uncharacterized protein n=1 Tax=Mesorhabditis belari TaxID=2138241 RepID=A0AAF3JB77_9BILA
MEFMTILILLGITGGLYIYFKKAPESVSKSRKPKESVKEGAKDKTPVGPPRAPSEIHAQAASYDSQYATLAGLNNNIFTEPKKAGPKDDKFKTY